MLQHSYVVGVENNFWLPSDFQVTFAVYCCGRIKDYSSTASLQLLVVRFTILLWGGFVMILGSHCSWVVSLLDILTLFCVVRATLEYCCGCLKTIVFKWCPDTILVWMIVLPCSETCPSNNITGHSRPTYFRGSLMFLLLLYSWFLVLTCWWKFILVCRGELVIRLDELAICRVVMIVLLRCCDSSFRVMVCETILSERIDLYLCRVSWTCFELYYSAFSSGLLPWVVLLQS